MGPKGMNGFEKDCKPLHGYVKMLVRNSHMGILIYKKLGLLLSFYFYLPL